MVDNIGGKGWRESPDASGKAPIHRAVATRTKMQTILRQPMVNKMEDYVAEKAGLRLERTGQKDCLLGERFEFYDTSDNELDIWMRETPDMIQLSTIKAQQKGTKIGTKFMNALKDYSDLIGKKLVVPDITEPAKPYWNKFNWLVDDFVRIDDCGNSYWAKNTKSYTPGAKA